ncbi:MAG: metallophosphoesterase family protein [Candidatus Promineofilum sp.]|nr:metallophosphoesterase family protein [Promineifilum sp.]
MQIALISDIHGNLVALETALEHLGRQNIDRIVCLGDVAAGGPQPREVIERLRRLEIPVMMGNTDHWLLNPLPPDTADEADRRETEIELWSAAQLGAAELEAVADYRPALFQDFGHGFSLLTYHGSPHSYEDRIESTTPEETLDRWFGAARALVMAGGHTHEAMIRRYKDSIVVNPGSVGQPLYQTADGHSSYPTWAEYGLLAWKDGALSITLQRVPYPKDELSRAARRSGMPHVDYWLEQWRS